MQSLWTEEYDFFLKKKIIAAKHHLITESLILLGIHACTAQLLVMKQSISRDHLITESQFPYGESSLQKKKEMSWLHGK